MEVIEKLQIKNNANIYSLVFSPNSDYLVFGGFNADINILDLKTQRLSKLITDSCDVQGLVFSPDGLLLSGGGNNCVNFGNVSFWDIKTHQLIKKVKLLEINLGEEVHITNLNFSPNGKIITVLDTDVIIFLDSKNFHELHRCFIYSSSQKTIFSSDNKYIAYTSDSAIGKSGIIDLSNFKNITLLELEYKSCTSVAFNKKDNTFDFVYQGGGIDNTSPDDKGKIYSFKKVNGTFIEFNNYVQSQGISRIAYSPDYNFMASISWDSHLVKIWDNDTKKIINSFMISLENNYTDKHRYFPLEITYSPNGRFLVCSIQNNIYLWELKY